MSVFHDEVEIEDFEYDEDTDTFYFPCPCGDRFAITKVSPRDSAGKPAGLSSSSGWHVGGDLVMFSSFLENSDISRNFRLRDIDDLYRYDHGLN